MAYLTTNDGVVLTAVDGRILVTADHVFPVHVDFGIITSPRVERLVVPYQVEDLAVPHKVERLVVPYRVEDLARV